MICNNIYYSYSLYYFMITLEVGTLLFRCSKSAEFVPTPRFCSDTKKTGVYFTNNIKLAELMLLEHSESPESYDNKHYTEFITVYELTDDIDMSYGKYATNNIGSHYDPECIFPIVKSELYEYFCRNIISETKNIAEIFLDFEDIKKIEYKTCWPISINNIIEKYIKYFKIIVD